MPAYAPLTENEPPLAYLDCQPLGPGEAIIIAAIWGLEDSHDRPTRLLHVKDETVRFADIPENLISLCLAGDQVIALAKSGVAMPVFPDVGTPVPVGRPGGGTFLRLRNLGGVPYACGMNGQISRAGPEGWVPFDDGVYSDSRDVFSTQLRDIAGLDGKRLVTVGFSGAAFDYRDMWRPMDIPTNATLEQVIRDKAGRFWIAGQNGTLILDENGEMAFLDSGTSSSFWGLAQFRDEIYLSAFDGLFRWDDDSASALRLDHGLGNDITCYRLQASESELWSVGQDDILRYDGDEWHRVHIPSND
ncbi:hypothetical protein SAMN05421538_10727 [Paracoccus isoporae]|uniref:Uncharacterized protein n=1 Tax=Paracoccus isoporae TaxID=591205 RepID=A0A1G7D956_9RHOB|nr:hypothetical protein [Paracoccus isoporae]SDE48082.1 hypothetical protein SAMN05421538_10727 [Paracoccus isoporae]